jgi:hypothetical protein
MEASDFFARGRQLRRSLICPHPFKVKAKISRGHRTHLYEHTQHLHLIGPRHPSGLHGWWVVASRYLRTVADLSGRMYFTLSHLGLLVRLLSLSVSKRLLQTTPHEIALDVGFPGCTGTPGGGFSPPRVSALGSWLVFTLVA